MFTGFKIFHKSSVSSWLQTKITEQPTSPKPKAKNISDLPVICQNTFVRIWTGYSVAITWVASVAQGWVRSFFFPSEGYTDLK